MEIGDGPERETPQRVGWRQVSRPKIHSLGHSDLLLKRPFSRSKVFVDYFKENP